MVPFYHDGAQHQGSRDRGARGQGRPDDGRNEDARREGGPTGTGRTPQVEDLSGRAGRTRAPLSRGGGLAEDSSRRSRQADVQGRTRGDPRLRPRRRVIVDTPAIVAVILEEPQSERLLELMLREPALGIGTPTLAESGIVLTSRLGPDW